MGRGVQLNQRVDLSSQQRFDFPPSSYLQNACTLPCDDCQSFRFEAGTWPMKWRPFHFVKGRAGLALGGANGRGTRLRRVCPVSSGSARTPRSTGRSEPVKRRTRSVSTFLRSAETPAATSPMVLFQELWDDRDAITTAYFLATRFVSFRIFLLWRNGLKLIAHRLCTVLSLQALPESASRIEHPKSAPL